MEPTLVQKSIAENFWLFVFAPGNLYNPTCFITF